MIYYRRYTGDYLRKTSKLSLAEHGAYSVMLDHYYTDEAPLPLEKDEIYRMVRALTSADQKAVDKVLRLYFDKREDGYHNARADEEIAVSQKARANGSKSSGRPKKTKDETDDGTGGDTGEGTGEETESVTGSDTETVTEASETETQTVTGLRHPLAVNHLAVSLPAFQPLPANHQPTTVARTASRAKPENGGAKGAATWNAYALAYSNRYGVDPVRNAKTNAQISQFIDRIGVAEAPHVAAFYLRSSKSFYLSRKHPVSSLLADAEALRTEWATGRSGTQTEAQQADRTAALGNVFLELKEESRNARV